MPRLAFCLLMATPLLRAFSCIGGHDSPCRGLTQNSHIFFGKIIGISAQLPPSDISFTSNSKWQSYTYLITEPLYQTRLGEIVTVITDIRLPLGDQVFVHAYRSPGGTLIEGHSCPKLYTSSLPQYIRRSIRAGYKQATLQLYVAAGMGDAIPATILLEGPVRREVQFTPGRQLVVMNLPPGIYKITASAKGYAMVSPYLTYNVGPYSCPFLSIEMAGTSLISGTASLFAGKALANLYVYLETNGKIYKATNTNAIGEFLFDKVIPGQYTLRTANPNVSATSLPDSKHWPKIELPLDLGPGEVKDNLEIVQPHQEMASIRIRFMDRYGQPIVNRAISGYRYRDGLLIDQWFKVRTDSFGFADIAWLRGTKLDLGWQRKFAGNIDVMTVTFNQDSPQYQVAID